MERCSVQRRRRCGAAVVTAVVLALAVIAAPTLAYAGYHAVSILGDPYNSSVYARLSEEGRLGVRGETTSQAGVPSNEWHAGVLARADLGMQLLRSAPPGVGIGISQITASWYTPPESAVVHRSRPGTYLQIIRTFPTDEGCAARRPAPPAGAHEVGFEVVHEMLLPTPKNQEYGYAQLLFPVPLTPSSSPERGFCLYVRSDPREIIVAANGVEGPATAMFAPAKGQPSPPQEDPEGK